MIPRDRLLRSAPLLLGFALLALFFAPTLDPRVQLYYRDTGRLYYPVKLFIAEQLRLASASTILDARGIASAQEVGALPAAEQRSIVVAIVRREMGVMALAMAALCFLALRALGTAAGL